MNDDLEQLLKNLRLKRIFEILDREVTRATKKQTTYTQFLARLLREQYQYQQERSIAYRIRQANLPEKWSLESFPFKKQPGVRAKIIRQLAELDFIPKAENLVFIGDTGVGKTGLASSILLKALENGYRGMFIKAQDLFDEMYASLADRSSRKLLNRLCNFDVLLIDSCEVLGNV
jgi:DNA replication protein DnaC